MGTPNSGFINVDDLLPRVSVEQAAAFYGQSVEPRPDSTEVRVDCPFACSDQCDGKRSISINTGQAHKPFYCHAYECRIRGKLLDLMYGWKHGHQPSGGRLRGPQFREIAQDLRAIADGDATPQVESHPSCQNNSPRAASF